jgi:hypothetical protein
MSRGLLLHTTKAYRILDILIAGSINKKKKTKLMSLFYDVPFTTNRQKWHMNLQVP